jgi:hypothetical protein
LKRTSTLPSKRKRAVEPVGEHHRAGLAVELGDRGSDHAVEHVDRVRALVHVAGAALRQEVLEGPVEDLPDPFAIRLQDLADFLLDRQRHVATRLLVNRYRTLSLEVQKTKNYFHIRCNILLSHCYYLFI